MTVEVETISESGTSKNPAKVLVSENGRLVVEVIVKVELLPGADGGLYPCVILEKKETSLGPLPPTSMLS